VPLVDNASFRPAVGAGPAPEFSGTLRIRGERLRTTPELQHPVIGGRDARLFPGIVLSFFTVDAILVPIRRGEMIAESTPGPTPSYWDVIPQFGRVWREEGARGWSRAAFPLMLVNDTENHAHQGLATFLYRDSAVRDFSFQFVEQTAPYLLRQHFLAWGSAEVELVGLGDGDLADAGAASTAGVGEAGTRLASANSAGSNLAGAALTGADLEELRSGARAELAARLPSRPWSDLVGKVSPGVLDDFGGRVKPQWRVATALVWEGTLYYQDVVTPYGAYPYPLEMRFGVRSIMKSVAAPLALLRLAHVYGPYVLTLKIGDYVAGLDPKYDRIRFIDAANMASGFGGTGTCQTSPNDINDGYLGGDYDAWYTAPSHEEKLAQITQRLRPYPWDPGTVVRYRDQDFYLLGAAIDQFLKSVRGPSADAWDMLLEEVFVPIGIAHAPAIRTREGGDKKGVPWFNAGYYPTLDDLAKIALLYQNGGRWGDQQILHPTLTRELLSSQGALLKSSNAPLAGRTGSEDVGDVSLYKMGFHFTPYVGSVSGRRYYLPTMWGSGESEVILYPNQLVSICVAKAAQLPPGETATAGDSQTTPRAVDRLVPFA
jgi:CubicO group peptidase (beta-lactamase class C family)